MIFTKSESTSSSSNDTRRSPEPSVAIVATTKKTLAGSERNRMRNLTMADGRLDAPYHRMKRLEFRRVFIDAGPLASNPGIRSSRCLCILPIFPDSGNSLATFAINFTQGDWSADAAITFLRSRDVSRSSCSRTAGCPKAACTSDSNHRRSQSRHQEPASDRIAGTIRPPAPSRGTCRPRA